MAELSFNTERHVKYYLRCLKTFLPGAYTSNDSNRMLLGFFILSGLDTLGVLESRTTDEERQGYIDWIYCCQVPSGGFRGFTGTNFGEERRNENNEAWDPANVPATFFALVNLLILGDDLSGVKRRECLQWLPNLQRADGSFGELLGPEQTIEGDSDLRYCCCASGIRYLLRGKNGKGVEDVQDIDVPRFVSFIEACQAYDGGMAESPFREPHSGHTYCAVGSLEFLRRAAADTQSFQLLLPGSASFETLVAWLASRQTGEIDPDAEDEDEDEEDEDTEENNGTKESNPQDDGSSIEERILALPHLTPIGPDSIPCAGFNGRYNKVADTCYSFWNGATLMILDRYGVVDDVRNRRYLLEKVQHLVGGFGKAAGDPPDLLHSYFGMVSLAFQSEAGLARVDPALVTSERVLRHLQSLPWHS